VRTRGCMTISDASSALEQLHPTTFFKSEREDHFNSQYLTWLNRWALKPKLFDTYVRVKNIFHILL